MGKSLRGLSDSNIACLSQHLAARSMRSVPRLTTDISLAALAGCGEAVRAFDISRRGRSARRRNEVAAAAAFKAAEGPQAFVPGRQLAGVEDAVPAESDSRLTHGGARA